MRKLVISIDGPAGAGKSDAAEGVAKRLGYVHYNSGLTYRAITFVLLQKFEKGCIPDLETERLVNLVNNMDLTNTGKEVLYNGKNITSQLRTSQVDRYVSFMSKAKHVREKCRKVLFTFIENNNIGLLVEGRDIGTSVLPEADVKIYLTASVEARAKRRRKQSNGDYSKIMESISQRDEEDRNRKVGPLKCADDAVIVDNSTIDLEETIDRIVQIAMERTNDK